MSLNVTRENFCNIERLSHCHRFVCVFPADQEGDGGDEYTEQLEIEPTKVGRIVGKGGATINQLQSDFSVKIDIEKEDNAAS